MCFTCLPCHTGPPDVAQVGPGIALLGGFQGLLGALWGRLGAGNAPGSATAAPSSPQMRKTRILSCFLRVFRPHRAPRCGPRWPRDRAIGRFPRAPGRSLGPPWRWQRSQISHSGPREPLEAEKHVFSRVFWRGAPPDDPHRGATAPHKFGLPGPPLASKDAI